MKNIIAGLLIGVTIISCKKEEVTTNGKYDSGLIILNEGPFGSGSGSVSFWDRATGKTTEDVFEIENSGAKIGNILQSMTRIGDWYYFVVNNANKIVITDLQFKFKSEITGLSLPRYLIYKGNKAYITQWGTDGLSGSLLIVDLNTGQIAKTIPLGKGPEDMLLMDDKLFISLVGGYDRDNRVVIFDIVSETIQKFIEVGDNPAQLAVDGSNMWVLCKGYNDFVTPANSTTGSLVKMNVQGTIIESIDLSDFADNLLPTDNAGNYVLTINGQPAVFNSIAKTIQKKAIASYIYKLGYDRSDKRILLLDAGDFASKGKAYITDSAFNFIDTVPTGLVPTAVYEAGN